MPRQNKKVAREDILSPYPKKATIEAVKYSPSSVHSGESSPTNLQVEDDKPAIDARSGKKRTFEDEAGGDFGTEMQKMLEMFGADISKTLSCKKKRLEQLTQTSLKKSTSKAEEMWKGQQNERMRLQEEYCRQADSVFHQWEIDIEKMKEQEEKLTTLFKQEQKMFQQARIVLGQRIKTLRQLNEQFVRGMGELEKNYQAQQGSVQAEMKKEMALLQKRILMDMQQREVSNVRKSLQTMLF